MSMIDICPWCGTEAELYSIGEESICESCIEESGFVACDVCGGYFPSDLTVFYNLTDGRKLCEDCALYALNSGELDEDDVESIEEPEDEDED